MSTTSSSSLSSSSSGEEESLLQLQEVIEEEIQMPMEYRTPDLSVKRPELSQLMAARRELINERAAASGVRPRVSFANLSAL